MKWKAMLTVVAFAVLCLNSCRNDGADRSTADQEKKPPRQELFEVSEKGKLGLIDRTGQVVVEPQFDALEPFSEGLAAARIGNKWGYIDSSGVFRIKPEFDWAESFSEGLALVKTGGTPGWSRRAEVVMKGGKYGYINKSGEFVINPEYDHAYSFSDSLAAVMINQRESQWVEGDWGFIDRTGHFVVPAKYSYVRDFEAGSAWVQRVKEGVAYSALIDRTGKVLFGPERMEMATFYDGLALVTINGKCGYINRSGELAISPQFEPAYSPHGSTRFHKGLAAVRIDGKWGYIDKEGKIVIAPQFDEVAPFSEGFAAVKVGNKWGCIDRHGEMVIEPQFDDVGLFLEGLAIINRRAGSTHEQGIIDKSGKVVVPPGTYDEIGGFYEGLSTVKVGGLHGAIDKSGKLVVQLQECRLRHFTDGLFRADSGFVDPSVGYMSIGYLDSTGKVIWAPRW